MQCGAPILMLGVGDARGIRTAQLTLGGQTLALKPGTFHPQYSRGLHATLPESVLSATDGLAATLDLELVGTERLSIVPLGSNTEVQLSSGWRSKTLPRANRCARPAAATTSLPQQPRPAAVAPTASVWPSLTR